MGYSVDKLYIGQKADFSKTITETDIYLFAGITGDFNPAHVNKEYASGTHFKGQIAHGMLCGGLISAVIGMQLPGPGTIYLSQELNFVAPVYPGDTITAMVEVASLNRDRNRVELHTSCINQRGDTVLEGTAMAKPPLAKRNPAG